MIEKYVTIIPGLNIIAVCSENSHLLANGYPVAHHSASLLWGGGGALVILYTRSIITGWQDGSLYIKVCLEL